MLSMISMIFIILIILVLFPNYESFRCIGQSLSILQKHHYNMNQLQYNRYGIITNLYQSSFDYPFPDRDSDWYSAPGDCLVLFPSSNEPTPKSIIHFIGGFLAGSVVTVTYSAILQELANQGHIVVATPIPVSRDHGKVAADISKMFTRCYNDYLTPIIGASIKIVPIISVSHSLGGKLTALLISRKEDRKTTPARKASVFLAFNNYGFSESINLSLSQAAKMSPEVGKVVDAIRDNNNVQNLVDNFVNSNQGAISDIFNNAVKRSSNNVRNTASLNGLGAEVSDIINNVIGKELTKIGDIINDQTSKAAEKVKNIDIDKDFEFVPSPDETWDIIKTGYNVQKNVLIKFDQDNIDQSLDLAMRLKQRGCDVKIITQDGNHLTPNTNERNSELFSKKLSTIINKLSMEIWDSIDDDQRKRYQLPEKTSNNWDNDDF